MEGGVTRGETLAIFNMLPTGAHKSGAVNGINMKQVSECTMEVGGAGIVCIDGEVIKHDGTLAFEVLKHRLEIFCPASYAAPSPAEAEASKKADWV